MLTPELLDSLATHVAIEQRNGVAYQGLYQAARADGWEGFAKRFKDDAIDEFEHAQNWLKFIAKFNQRAPLKLIPEGVEPEAAIADMVGQAADLERQTEQAMNAVLMIATAANDGAAIEWISGKLLEQVKERKQAEDFAARVRDAAATPGCLELLNVKLNGGKI